MIRIDNNDYPEYRYSGEDDIKQWYWIHPRYRENDQLIYPVGRQIDE